MLKGSKEALAFLLITFLIFNWFFNPKKVLESWDLDLSNHTIQCYVCRRGQKLFWLSTPSTCFDIHSIGWYCWKGLSLSFLKLFRIENQLNIKKVMSKNAKASFCIFWRGQRPLYTEYTFNSFHMSKMSNLTLYTVLCKSHNHYFRPFRHE